MCRSEGILARYPLHCRRTEAQGSRGMENAALNHSNLRLAVMEDVNSRILCSMGVTEREGDSLHCELKECKPLTDVFSMSHKQLHCR